MAAPYPWVVSTTSLAPVVAGHSTDLMIGEWVVALGNPYAYLLGNAEPTVTVGVVSAAGRNILPSGGGKQDAPGVDAYDPANAVVFAVGPVTDTTVFGRQYDQRQWAHAFGVSLLPVAGWGSLSHMIVPSTVLGLGTMGAAMAANLARAGFSLTVWNRTPERAR